MMVRRVRCGSDDEPDDFAEEEVKDLFSLCVYFSRHRQSAVEINNKKGDDGPVKLPDSSIYVVLPF